MPKTKGSPGKKAAKKATKYKKAPEAPKRFKSAFIIFSADKHKEIKKKLEGEGRAEKTTDIAKLVSESWKSLPAEDREVWEAKAEEDRARYETEKANYKGPWKIPANNKRSTKDPSAPKRPMSAFLAYSNSRRAELKRKNPKATNADLSKMLSKSWKELPSHERAVYMEEEAALRAKYKTDMAVWRKKAAKQKKAERIEQEEMEAPEEAPVANRGGGAPANDPASQLQQQQQLMEQMQQQQQEFMANSMGMAGGAGLMANGGNDAMGQMTMEQQQALMQQQQQREAMLTGVGDASGGLGGMGDANAAAMQQNMNAGLFGGGNNPYALQAAGLGGGVGFPNAMGAAAFGFNSAAGTNPYLANALANQAAFMQGAGQAGSLSALMGQNFGNPMGQLPNQGLNQGANQGMNQSQGLNQGMNQGFYGNNLGGYGLGNFEGN